MVNFKKINIIFFTSILISLFGCKNNYEENNMKIIDTKVEKLDMFDSNCINLFGRTVKVQNNGIDTLFCGFTSTGFEIVVDIIDKNNSLIMDYISETGDHEHQYIKTYLDYNVDSIIELNKGNNNEVTLFKNLSEGRHSLKVLKMNELSTTKLYIKSINGEGYEYYKRTYEPKKKLIAFYGDSITAGYGNLGDSNSKTYYTKEQDGTLSYAQQTCDKLGYESSIIGWSGVALSSKLAPYGVDIMDKFDTYDGVNKYDFNLEKPYIVVMNLGSNDNSGYTDENKNDIDRENGINEYIENYSIIVDKIKKYSPDCKIISCYNMCGIISNKLISAIKKSTSNINQKYGDNTAYTLEFMSDRSGSNFHPSLQAHNVNSDELVQFIKKEIIKEDK